MSLIRKIGATTLCVAFLIIAGCKPSTEQEGANGSEKAQSSNELGDAALEKGEWTRADDAFSAAIEQNGADSDSYYGRATATLAIAKEHYNLAQAAATNQDVKTGEEEAKKADEYFQRTLDDCAKMLELNPKDADAYFLRGVVAQFQGNWESGVEAFTECVKLDPERALAYHHRGEIYDHIGDYMNATVDFKKAGELGYVAPKEETTGAANAEDFSDLNYNPEEGTDATKTEASVDVKE